MTVDLEQYENQLALSQQDDENQLAFSAASVSEDGEKARLIEQGRAFFCSELVLKAYKCVGLILSNEACSNWLPVDLTSEANRLQLQKGATLGPEELLFTDSMFRNY